eukprot:CAMPEP_0175966346 /NCGR_PEP_ID=MMETSP0108-20121206/38629_1 /TAXON_ID=195067 ORGANISM="Goniomonas pacifica, Strain CCMP1869" /NCGR_SAMPLE_ID=MMETSP0108 /ASSEMBLY_ACC=CAM_ASM_000204 /LENGTH=110 /DNA_ID=CAMNT_0017294555 /DNA_START=6 /DNA_END=338 /DNA_ORIENTATION=+
MAGLFGICCEQRTQDERAGVGIAFQPDGENSLFVEALSVGGPAARHGNVQRGDCLIEIDGVNIHKRPIREIVDRMLGPKGSKVQLSFRRDGIEDLIRVDLVRGPSVDAPL